SLMDVLRLVTLDCQLPLLPEVSTSGRRQLTALPSVQEGWLLKGTVDDRCWIELQPLVEDRRVDAAEVHVRVEVALDEFGGIHRPHPAIGAPLAFPPEKKPHPAGAVISSRAVIADATAKLREHQQNHVVGMIMLAKVLHKGVDPLGHGLPQN